MIVHECKYELVVYFNVTVQSVVLLCCDTDVWSFFFCSLLVLIHSFKLKYIRYAFGWWGMHSEGHWFMEGQGIDLKEPFHMQKPTYTFLLTVGSLEPYFGTGCFPKKGQGLFFWRWKIEGSKHLPTIPNLTTSIEQWTMIPEPWKH